MKKQNGITVIALVITMIVMLILACVSIIFAIGNNGIITKATKTELEVTKGDVQEELTLLVSDLFLRRYAEDGTEMEITSEDIVKYLDEDIKLFINSPKEKNESGDTVSIIVDDHKGFTKNGYHYYMIDVSKLNKTPSYGRNSNWNEGNVFMIRRTVKDSTLGDEFELVYKDLNDDEIKEIGYIN